MGKNTSVLSLFLVTSLLNMFLGRGGIKSRDLQNVGFKDLIMVAVLPKICLNCVSD